MEIAKRGVRVLPKGTGGMWGTFEVLILPAGCEMLLLWMENHAAGGD